MEYRMYGLVPYNLSDIQKGIQFGHAVVEYGLNHNATPEYQNWANNHKTFIILNGGTTNKRVTDDTGEFIGSLNNYQRELSDMFITTANFHEPDLGDQLTAVVFIVDERVWNEEKFPGYKKWYETEFDMTCYNPNYEFTEDDISPDGEYYKWSKLFDCDYTELVKIIKLRKFLKGFKLA